MAKKIKQKKLKTRHIVRRKQNKYSQEVSDFWKEFNPYSVFEDAKSYYGEAIPYNLEWKDEKNRIYLYRGDSVLLLDYINKKYPEGIFDLIFTDSPYCTGNDVSLCQAGKKSKLKKGKKEKYPSVEQLHEFNRKWLAACQKTLKPNGAIFVSGSSLAIHSIGFAMQQLGYKILNDIKWIRPVPIPSPSHKWFSNASETIIWATKSMKSKHKFNYAEMRKQAGNKQMKSVMKDITWNPQDLIIAEKSKKELYNYGTLPVQTPLMLSSRLIMAATEKNDWIFNPFLSYETTAISAQQLQRMFAGCRHANLN